MTSLKVKTAAAFPNRNEKATETYSRIIYCITLAGEILKIVEKLINHCRVDIAESLLEEKSVDGITPLSNERETNSLN